MCVREREDLVFVRSFRKLSCSVYALGNACSVFSYKATDDCHGIVKGTLASQ